MTRDDYADAVFYRASRGNPEIVAKVYRTAAQSNLPDALKKLAQMSVLAGWRSLLEVDYALTLTALFAPFGANTDLLPESIQACDDVSHVSVTQKFKPVMRRSDLGFEIAVPDCPYGFYYVSKSGIDIAYALLTLTGTLTVRAVKVPTVVTNVITNLDARLEDRLVDVGMSLIQSGLPAQQQPTQGATA